MTNREWERQTQVTICKEVVAQFRKVSLKTGYHIEDISHIYKTFAVYHVESIKIENCGDSISTIYKKLNELNRTFQEYITSKWPPSMINTLVKALKINTKFPGYLS